jgi:superfamily II DNA or RNA helicase
LQSATTGSVEEHSVASVNLRLRLAQKVSRLALEELYALSDFQITATQQAVISFESLSEPQIQLSELLGTTEIEDVGITLTSPLRGQESDHIFVPFSAITAPIVESVSLGFAKVRFAGKVYTPERNEGTTSPEVTDLGDSLPLFAARCPHGLIKSACSICHENQVRQRREKPRASFDVFELLRYVLQPPIIERIDHPDVFPEGRKPYPFQVAGIRWLLDHPHALLADEMGLGKTMQAIMALRVLFRNGKLQRALVVCPAGLRENWMRELDLWAPELRTLKVFGPPDLRAEQWKTAANVFVVSYDTLVGDVDGLASIRFGACIIDEAQYIKTPDAARSRVVKTIQADHKWALTGTPLENDEQDTVSIFGFVHPGLFARQEVVTSSEVRHGIAPFTLRRTIQGVGLELPELKHEVHWLELTDSQRAQYDSEEAAGVARLKSLGETATRVHVFSLINKLKLICNYDEESGQSCKLEYLDEHLEKVVASQEKALVFSQYPNVTLRRIQPTLQRFSPMLYDGSLSETERTRYVDDFQNNDTHKVLLMGVKSGGTGITLTRANHVFHYDHWWNPAVVDQASARVYRIGQKLPVFIHSLYTSDTIEEKIDKLLAKKRNLFTSVFGELEDSDVLKRVSDEELFGLFGLKAPTSKSTKKSLLEISPVDFETLVQKLFDRLGYRLKVTKRSHDGGIDLEGTASGFGGGRVAVQCKRYSGTVSVEKIREFWGAISESKVAQGFFVTTGRFTREAENFAQGKRLRLIAEAELTALLATNNITW